jgi:hypothetical protein
VGGTVLENRENADQQTRGGRSDDAREDAENAAAAPQTSTAGAAPGRFPPQFLNATVVSRLDQWQP